MQIENRIMKKAKTEFKIGERYTLRELQEFAVEEMHKSIPEHEDRTDPKVGAILATADGVVIEIAHRGELAAGDHAEFTLLERKCRDEKLDGCILFATLEPCAPGARKEPKLSCAERIVNRRIKKIYIGIQDPDPTVKGKGEEYLRSNNVEIEYFDKDLQNEIIATNEKFMEEARERARIADLKDLQPQKNEFEVGLQKFAFNDFSQDALQLFIERAGLPYDVDSEEFKMLLAKWDFIDVDIHNKRPPQPTGWGLMLFGKRPTDKYSQARVKFTVVKVEGQEPEIKDFTEAFVKLPNLIDTYLGFIFPTIIDRSNFTRKDLTELSKHLLREAIINAIVHRDYTIEGAQILIHITPKEILIKSPGMPIVPMEKLQTFTAPTVSRNPKIADVFLNMKFIERRGMGMEEIQKYRPKPVYDFDSVNTVLTIKRNTIVTKDDLTEEKLVELGLNQRQINAVFYMKEEGQITNAKYQEINSISKRTATNDLSDLVQKHGFVRNIGVGAGSYYELIGQ